MAIAHLIAECRGISPCAFLRYILIDGEQCNNVGLKLKYVSWQSIKNNIQSLLDPTGWKTVSEADLSPKLVPPCPQIVLLHPHYQIILPRLTNKKPDRKIRGYREINSPVNLRL